MFLLLKQILYEIDNTYYLKYVDTKHAIAYIKNTLYKNLGFKKLRYIKNPEKVFGAVVNTILLNKLHNYQYGVRIKWKYELLNDHLIVSYANERVILSKV